MSIPIYQVDAFTDKLFSGNPAAVVLLEGQAETTWMQSVAREMNLSETAFVHPQQGGYHLQWFTPQVEVDLCGHATLASAHILWQTGLVKAAETIRFFTRSGWLSVSQRNDLIEMDFPSAQVVPVDVTRFFCSQESHWQGFVCYRSIFNPRIRFCFTLFCPLGRH